MLMKTITNISSNGIDYIDDEGEQQFIDFESCHKNDIDARSTDQLRAFYKRLKRVAIRLTFREPPAIEFFTVPRTHFEFSTREKIWEVVRTIKEAGWRIGDGE